MTAVLHEWLKYVPVVTATRMQSIEKECISATKLQSN